MTLKMCLCLRLHLFLCICETHIYTFFLCICMPRPFTYLIFLLVWSPPFTLFLLSALHSLFSSFCFLLFRLLSFPSFFSRSFILSFSLKTRGSAYFSGTPRNTSPCRSSKLSFRQWLEPPNTTCKMPAPTNCVWFSIGFVRGGCVFQTSFLIL